MSIVKALSAIILLSSVAIGCSNVGFGSNSATGASQAGSPGGPGGGTPGGGTPGGGTPGGGGGNDNGIPGTGTGQTTPQCVYTMNQAPIITQLPSGVTQAMIASICPAIGHDSECGVVIIIGSTGPMLYFTGQGPYDGNDDTLVGVLNMGATPINSLDLSSVLDIMGFDGDGITRYTITGTSMRIPGNIMDQSGYGGPNAYYSNIGQNNNTGTVNFLTPVATGGGTSYFGLENALTSLTACLILTPH